MDKSSDSQAELQFNVEQESFRPFQQSPLMQKVDFIERKESDFLEKSYSLNNGHYKQYPLQKKTTIFKFPNKLFGLVRIDKLVKEFIQKLMKQSNTYNSDIARIVNKFFKEKYLSMENQLNLHNKQIQKEMFFDSSCVFIKIWESIRALLLIIILWYYPFAWSFTEDNRLYFFPILISIIFYFFVDIIVRLNTSIIVQGNIVFDRQKIFKYYLTNDMLSDFIYLASQIIEGTLEYFYSENQDLVSAIFLTLLLVISYQKLSQIINQFQQQSNFNQIQKEYLNLVNLLFSISLFAHLLACIWHFIGVYSGKQFSQSWLLVKGIQQEYYLIRYCYSYYWATVTMITVGYGDITPTNSLETFICIILMFMACVVFAFSINKIGQILQSINDSKSQLQQNIRIITQYMKKNNIPIQFQEQIRSYLLYIYNESLIQNSEKLNVIKEQLSIKLKNELMYLVFQQMIKKSALMQNFSQQSLQQIAKKIKSHKFCPDEIIFSQSSDDDHSLYFIEYGQVKLIEQRSQTIIAQFEEQNQFGEIEFFTKQPRQFTALSVGFSTIFKISENEFYSCLTSDDQQIFHQLRDQIQHKISTSGITCLICNSDQHQTIDCTYIFFKPKLTKLIQNQNSAKNFVRKKYKRRDLKQNCFVFIRNLHQKQKLIIQNLFQDDKNCTYQSEENEETQKVSVTQELNCSDQPSQEISIKLNQEVGVKQQLQQTQQSKRGTIIQLKQKYFESNQNSQKEFQRRPTGYEREKTVKTQTLFLQQNGHGNNEQIISMDIDKHQDYQLYYSKDNLSQITQNYNKHVKTFSRSFRKQKNTQKQTQLKNSGRQRLIHLSD